MFPPPCCPALLLAELSPKAIGWVPVRKVTVVGSPRWPRAGVTAQAGEEVQVRRRPHTERGSLEWGVST